MTTVAPAIDIDVTAPPSGVARAPSRVRCTICRHPERARIELAMARGAGKRATAKRFDVGADACFRHWHGHCSPALKAARKLEVLKPGANLASLVIEEDTGILEGLKVIRGALLSRFDLATELNDVPAMGVLSARLMKIHEMVGKLTGELRGQAAIEHHHLVFSPDYLTLRQRLLHALRPYPEATAAVVAAFTEAESATVATFTPTAITGSANVLEAAHG